MKKIHTESLFWKNTLKALIFISTIALIVPLFPSANSFNYYFEMGKPWRYELITAPFDFPIYKDEQRLQEEQHEALKNYTPYLNIDNQIPPTIYEKLSSEWTKDKSPQTIAYLTQQLTHIYQNGVISVELLETLQKENVQNVSLIEKGRKTSKKALNTLYTPRTAYESIITNSPETNQREILKLRLDKTLAPNVTLDTTTSTLARQEIINNISLTHGMVQSGQRIIGKGEIITDETYQILSSLQIAYQERTSTIHQSMQSIIGKILLVTLFILLQTLYLFLFRPRIFKNVTHLSFVALMILLMITLASLTIQHTQLSIYVIPFALLPIIIRVFFDSRTALFAHMVSTMLISFMVPNPFEFIILEMAVGMAAVSSLKEMTQRSQLAQTSIWIFITQSVLYVSFHLISKGDISTITWTPFAYFAISSLLLLFSYGFIYLFEKIFGLTSSITLVELTNVNSDLMIQFAEKAPGTFQHSLQVSNLATEAAKKINADSLLVRTGALYHDIGKMEHPHFFTENQHGDHNPLNDMPLEQAAQTIIAHVNDGIKLAKKHSLPALVTQFICTHHGTSKAKYFYNTFRNKYPDIQPDETLFTYPGPLPNTKETAILMMADAVEARSRSLNDYTEENIDKMVDDMINSQIADGMFKETNLSFRDVESIKIVFKEKIKNIYHHRIAYPTLTKQENTEENTENIEKSLANKKN